MRRFDYSFLDRLDLPQGTAALENSIQSLCALLERRREKDPKRFREWEARAAERSAKAIAILEPDCFPGFSQALAGAAEGDFLHILSSALNGGTFAQEKSLALGQALSAYRSASRSGGDALALVACAVLDTMCITPVPASQYACGLLLAQTLLYQAGISMCRYVSLADTLLRYRTFFQRAYQEAARGWEENANDYTEFICIFLSLLYLGLRELVGSERKPKRPAPRPKKATKRTMVEDFVRNSPEPVSKSDICKALPQISPTTVEAVLGAMVKSGMAKKLGAARSVRYIRNCIHKRTR